MAFFESPRFPETLAMGAEGGPSYVVDVVETRSGFEQRNLLTSEVRHRFTIGKTNRPSEEFETLNGFFRMVKGRLHGFRFKFPLDFTTTSTTGILTLVAGSPANQWQMYKRYTSGAYSDDHKIVKPVVGTVSVYEDGLPMGSGFSIDHTTGIVTISSYGSPAPTFTWSGEFDFAVRFDTDLMKPGYYPISGTEKLGSWEQVELVELRL